MYFTYLDHTDDELLQLMRLHDSKSFEVIYMRYMEPLLNYTIRVTRNKEDAADILQEIFVSLWNRREEIEFTHSLKAWLYQSVRFQAAKYIHQHRRKHNLLQELVDLTSVTDTNSPHSFMEERELSATLRKTIDNMPIKMKEVFVLSREHHLSHREISHKLNIAESTVKKQVQNALRFIREKNPVEFIIFISIFSGLF